MALTVDSITHASTSASASIISTTHTTGSSANLLLVFVLWVDNSTSSAPVVNDVTFNSTSLTYLNRARRQYVAGQYTIAEAWAMTTPSIGAYTVDAIVSEATSHGLAVVCVSFNGAGGTGATGVNSAAGGTAPTITVTTTASGSMLIAGMSIRGGDITGVTPGAGVTEHVDANSGTLASNDNTYWVASVPGTGGADTLSGTQDANADHWSMVAVEVLASAGGVSVTPSAASAATGAAGPTVVLGSLHIVPSAASATSAAVAPTVILGSVVVVPTKATASSGTGGPTVINAVILTPSAASAATVATGPTVVLGAITFSPSAASAATGVAGPTVVLSSIVTTPSAAGAISGASVPTVVLGSISITPGAASAASGATLGTAFVITAAVALTLRTRVLSMRLCERATGFTLHDRVINFTLRDK